MNCQCTQQTQIRQTLLKNNHGNSTQLHLTDCMYSFNFTLLNLSLVVKPHNYQMSLIFCFSFRILQQIVPSRTPLQVTLLHHHLYPLIHDAVCHPTDTANSTLHQVLPPASRMVHIPRHNLMDSRILDVAYYTVCHKRAV